MNNDNNIVEYPEGLTFRVLSKFGDPVNITMTEKDIVKIYAEKWGYSRTPQTLPNVKWPEPEQCPRHSKNDDEINCGFCRKSISSLKMLDACKKAVGEAQIKQLELTNKFMEQTEKMIDEMEAQPAGLVPINLEIIEALFYQIELQDIDINNPNIWWEVRGRYHNKLKEICSKFGTPALPSVDEIELIIKSNTWWTFKDGVQCSKAASAIHDRLRGEEK